MKQLPGNASYFHEVGLAKRKILTAGCGSQPELVWLRECLEAISLCVEWHVPEEAAQFHSDTDESRISAAVNPRLAFVESDLPHAENEVHVPRRQLRVHVEVRKVDEERGSLLCLWSPRRLFFMIISRGPVCACRWVLVRLRGRAYLFLQCSRFATPAFPI